MARELSEVIDEFEWWKLLSIAIEKEVDGGGVNNIEGQGNFLAEDLVEEAKVNI